MKSFTVSFNHTSGNFPLRFLCFSLILVLGTNVLRAQQTESEPSFWSHRISMTKDVSYGEDDQQRLDIFMQGNWIGEHSWFKQAPSKRPTLIYMHGGGWVGGDKESRIGFFIHYLERGWNVVNVEYRLGNNTAPQAVDDVLCAVQWVADNADTFNIDTGNIVLSGESAGGHLCLIAGLMNSVPGSHPCYVGDKITIQGIINWFGISDIAKAGKYLKNTEWNYVLAWIGNQEKIAEISKKYSPIHYVTHNAPPILTIHGASDSIVPHNQAQLLHEALDKAGTKHQLLTLTGGKHLGFSEEQFQLIYKTIYSFLGDVMD